MRRKTYRISLTAEGKKRLEDIINKGVHPAGQVRRARILLLLDEGKDRERKPVKELERSEIAEQCGCSLRAEYTVSKQ